MLQVEITQTPSQVRHFIEKVLQGQDVIFMQQDKPLARLAAIKTPKQRPFGIAKGLIKMADDFDDPLPEFAEYM